jgi:hypothetical protein
VPGIRFRFHMVLWERRGGGCTLPSYCVDPAIPRTSCRPRDSILWREGNSLRILQTTGDLGQHQQVFVTFRVILCVVHCYWCKSLGL